MRGSDVLDAQRKGLGRKKSSRPVVKSVIDSGIKSWAAPQNETILETKRPTFRGAEHSLDRWGRGVRQR